MGYPVELDFTIIQGDDFVHEFQWQDENCDPILLEGEYFAQVRRKGVLVADFDTEYTGSVLTISIPAEVTSTLAPVSGAKWDLEHHDAGGDITTPIGGKVEIMEDVTEVGS